ncbi:zf-CCHC domain-containing protein [Tanacetum coccineum]|uniref:Zf-CCHC domain-containing protein n=1 Tax=Tanacetum coccineum TaxID=301880 RepID=A0ABQ5HES3_9ASTR
MIKYPKTKLLIETPFERLKDDEKKKLRKNNEAKMTLYKALPHKEYEQVFMCKTAKEIWHTLIITHQGNSQGKDCKIDLLTQQYDKFSTSSEETIDSGFTQFNVIGRGDDELIGNLKVYEMVLENDGVVSKTTKEKVKSLALKAKINREQTSDDSDSQRGGDDDEDEEFGKDRSNGFGNRGVRSSRQKRGCYNCGGEGHFIGECLEPKENKAFVGGAWSDSEEGDEPQKDATCLMAIDSHENEELLKFNKKFTKSFENLLKEKRSLENEQSKLFSKINELELEVKKLTKAKELVEPCQSSDVLTQEVESLKSNVSKL